MEAGKFYANPRWIEYLINMFNQEFFSELWEEVMKTKISLEEMLERIAYGSVIESSWDRFEEVQIKKWGLDDGLHIK